MSTYYYVYCPDCQEDGGYVFSNHCHICLEKIPFIMKHVMLGCNILFADEHCMEYDPFCYINRRASETCYLEDSGEYKGVIDEDLEYHRHMLDLYELCPEENKDLIERLKEYLKQKSIEMVRD